MNARKAVPFLLVLGLGLGIAGAAAPRQKAQEAAAPTAPIAAPAYDPRATLAPLVEQLQPAVVSVMVEAEVDAPEIDPEQIPEFMRPFIDPERMPRQRQGQGSGFLISGDGYILTNHHVVDGATEVKVALEGQGDFDARVVGTDPRIDLALVKIDAAAPLPHVKLGSSDATRVGDWVVAIGNPFGLSHTVTAGIVSAKGRVIGAGPYDDFLQTDASINPGNSGGPLFNLQGEVVGINTAINAAGQGIAYAIPIDMVKDVLEDLKTKGTVARGWIGVGLQPMDEELERWYGVEGGALVNEVHEGTPAAKAGIRDGDVIVKVDGEPVDDVPDLIKRIGSHRAGEEIDIALLRDGKEKLLDVKLGERPDERALARGELGAPSKEPGADAPDRARADGWGITVAAPSEVPGFRPTPQTQDKGGVVITEVDEDGPAGDKLRPGDLVVEANGLRVASSGDLEKALGKGKKALIVVYRGSTRVFVAIERS